MTYNFDPDKWHQDQLLLLRRKLEAREITREAHDRSVLELEERLEEMWRRLDGSYQIGREKDPCA